MKFLTILFAVLSGFCCTAQNLVYLPKIFYTSYTVADNDLKGKVKSVSFLYAEKIAAEEPKETEFDTTTLIQFNEKSLMTSYLVYNYTETEGEISFESRYKYNAADQLVQTEDLLGDSKSVSSYSYNAEGKIQEFAYTTSEESGKIIYTYDSKNQKITTSAYTGKTMIQKGEAFMDAQGRIIKMVSYECPTKKCEENSSIEYTYDAQNNLLKEVSTGVSPYSIEYQYDAKNLLVKRISDYTKMEAGISEETFEYNDNGLLIKHHTAAAEGDAVTEPITYEHDAQGNWIKMTTNDTLGNSYITKRVITYY